MSTEGNHPAFKRSAGLAGSAIFCHDTWDEIARSLGFSGRELQIVRRVFDNQTEPAIADNLGVSSHTVHTHVQRLHRKLAVNDRVQLVQRVVEEFLALTASPDHTLPPICSTRSRGRCSSCP